MGRVTVEEATVEKEEVERIQCDGEHCKQIVDEDEAFTHLTVPSERIESARDSDDEDVLVMEISAPETKAYLCGECEGEDEYVRLKQYEADVESLAKVVRKATVGGVNTLVTFFLSCLMFAVWATVWTFSGAVGAVVSFLALALVAGLVWVCGLVIAESIFGVSVDL